MYGLIGKIIATPGCRDDLAAILAGIGPMPGCLTYVVAHDPSDRNGVWVTEVWESAEAHEASLQQPEVREAIARGRPLITRFEHRFETEPVGGLGLPRPPPDEPSARGDPSSPTQRRPRRAPNRRPSRPGTPVRR